MMHTVPDRLQLASIVANYSPMRRDSREMVEEIWEGLQLPMAQFLAFPTSIPVEVQDAYLAEIRKGLRAMLVALHNVR